MTIHWTCSNCGCVHWDGLKPISCIMCDNDEFLDGPETTRVSLYDDKDITGWISEAISAYKGGAR